MGFKVADLIIMFSNNYCFYKTPNEIRNEIPSDLSNIQFEENDLKNCSGIKVCFAGDDPNCDIIIQGMCSTCDNFYEYGSVKKRGEDLVYYTDNLLYGAIFSENSIYECNVKRLISKFNQLGSIYEKKAEIIQEKGCDTSSFIAGLSGAIDFSRNLNNSDELIPPNELFLQTQSIDSENQNAQNGCRIY